MAITVVADGFENGTAVCVLGDGTFAVASGAGKIHHIDRAGTFLHEVVAPSAPVSIAAHPTLDGVLALVTGSGVWEVLFDGTAPTLVRALAGGRGMVVDPISATALVGCSPAGGELVRASLASPTEEPRVLGDHVGRPRGVAARVGGASAWVLAGGAVRFLREVDLMNGTGLGHQVFGLDDAGCVCWAGSAGTVLALGSESGRIVLVDTARPTAAPRLLVDGLEPVWHLDLLPAATPGDPVVLVAGIGEALALVDVPAQVPDVVLELPTAPLYLSGWARVGVSLANGRTVEDIVFAIEPPEGGMISVSKDASVDHRPSVILSAAAMPGRYDVVALDRANGDKLAVAQYTVTDEWKGVDGPPVAIVGKHGADDPDPAWGGGDPNRPQNLSVWPQLGTRDVAVAIVESSDVTALSTAAQGTLRTEWRNEIFDGVVRDGVTESTRAYYRDVSDGAFDLRNAGVVGPVRLTGTWAGYSPVVANAATGQTSDWEGWAKALVANLRRQNDDAAAAGNPPVVDLRTVDSIIMVIRSLPGTAATATTPAMPGRFIWPSATRPGGYRLTFEVGRRTISFSFPWGNVTSTVPEFRTIDMFAMPDDWVGKAGNGGRVRRETATHELGHNLGLPDEYARPSHSNAVKARDLTASTNRGQSWSLMSWEQRFPQMTVVEKMMLGWVKREHVRNLSFATLGPVDTEVVLHRSDVYPPPRDQFSAVEVRIADGVNYYFEYRREDATHLSDEDLPVDKTVFGVQCWSGEEPSDHRNILRLQNDTDNDKAEFQVGDDYREEDVSDPSYPNDFIMKVISTGSDSAKVHVRYGDKKPDPQIRPWAPSTNWKSPDLEVTNARNQADGRWRDVPWENHDNRIVATVRNPAGQLDALQVRVDFFVKDFTTGAGAERAYGSAVHDVPAGQEVKFTSSEPWVPPALSLIPFATIPVHYCVVARIAEYHDPINPALTEITRDNNEAQSNHTRIISASSSPSSREIGFVKVANPFPEAASCRVQVRQTSEFYRTYLEHSRVWLGPGEERDVMFLTESMVNDPTAGEYVERHLKEVYEKPNSVRLTGIVDAGRVCHGFVTGGSQVLVQSARATRFVFSDIYKGLAQGEIRTVDDNQGVNGIVLVSFWPPGAPEKGSVVEGEVHNGSFEFTYPSVGEGLLSQAHYLGDFDKAPCDSTVMEVRELVDQAHPGSGPATYAE